MVRSANRGGLEDERLPAAYRVAMQRALQSVQGCRPPSVEPLAPPLTWAFFRSLRWRPAGSAADYGSTYGTRAGVEDTLEAPRLLQRGGLKLLQNPSRSFETSRASTDMRLP